MKRKNNKSIIYLIITIIIFCIVFIIIKTTNGSNDKKDVNHLSEGELQKRNEEIVLVNEIKQETGVKADSDLYQIDTEYDGRKVLNIRADIQYKVAFCRNNKKTSCTNGRNR